jgi:acyl-CoA reductase-like NAD-dependent aldehyde dehydrogenase
MEHVRFRLQDVAKRLDAGSGWVNTFPDTGPEAQFGGVKETADWGLWTCWRMLMSSLSRL